MKQAETASARKKPSAKLALPLLALLLAVSFVLGISLGSSDVDLPRALRELSSGVMSTHSRIFLYVRFPRVLANLLSGSALAVSGCLLQAALGNPLASPNIIGVNSGAGLFVFLCMAFFPFSYSLLPLAAFFGALLAAGTIWLIAFFSGAGKLSVVLAGIAVSSIFTAGINAVKAFFPDTLYNGSSFLIGGFSGVSMSHLFPAFIFILLGLAAAVLLGANADVLALGEETASSLGLNVVRTRFLLTVTACILAGAAVSFSGLIGFAGLIVPHIARRLFGNQHRVLIPASALMGGTFVILCDLASRLVFAPYEIPVGIIMSLAGGPFFIFLILRQRRRR